MASVLVPKNGRRKKEQRWSIIPDNNDETTANSLLSVVSPFSSEAPCVLSSAQEGHAALRAAATGARGVRVPLLRRVRRHDPRGRLLQRLPRSQVRRPRPTHTQKANLPLFSPRGQLSETSASVSYIRGNASISLRVNVQAQVFAGAVPR